jgi:hypothetical protein
MSEREPRIKLKRCLRCHASLEDDDPGTHGLCAYCYECSHTLVHWMIDHGIPARENDHE